jgi:hypothetical protein
MKVLVYSQQMCDKMQIEWYRDGTNISYTPNNIRKLESSKKTLYTLSFNYEFPFSEDTVYFAYSCPYTYSDLIEVLTKIECDEKKSEFCLRKTLCRTLAGNRCEYLTITAKDPEANLSHRKTVVLSARVHPGETVGSWMMQGVLDFLTNPTDPEAILLRRNFVFKIIPMLNPDGVINGNYRCSLAGCDLNRKWKTPSRTIHPCIYNAKKMILNLCKEREMAFFCDLHGHSRKKDVFMYGCHDDEAPEKTRVFPLLFSKICPLFSFENSKFGVQKSKERTSRISLWKEIGVPNIFTMEASFCGCKGGEFEGKHFTISQLMQIGRDMCRSLIFYYDIPNVILEMPPSNCKEVDTKSIMAKLIVAPDKKQFQEDYAKKLKDQVLSELKNDKELIEKGNDANSSSGSDDCPSEDNLSRDVLRHVLPINMKKGQQNQSKTQLNFATRSRTLTDGKSKEEKKIIVQPKIEKRNEKSIKVLPPPPPQVEEQKDKQSGSGEQHVTYVDAATQTEKIDFQKARYDNK